MKCHDSFYQNEYTSSPFLLIYKKNMESFLFWIVSSHCWCVDKRCYQLRRIIEYAKKNELRCISWHIWITWTSKYILLHASDCCISSFQAPIFKYACLFDKAYFFKYFWILWWYANIKFNFVVVTIGSYGIYRIIFCSNSIILDMSNDTASCWRL